LVLQTRFKKLIIAVNALKVVHICLFLSKNVQDFSQKEAIFIPVDASVRDLPKTLKRVGVVIKFFCDEKN